MVAVADVAKEGYPDSNAIRVKLLYLVNGSVDPKNIARPLGTSIGDKILYNPNACTRIGDTATGSFALDSSGVPTITGANGTLGVSYGIYDCTFKLNGTEKTVPVSGKDDATIESRFTFFSQDSDGFSVFTPADTGRLIYCDPTLGNDSTAGPTGNSTDHYTGASQPTGGWSDPSSVNAYATIATAFGQIRDGFADWVLLKYGEEYIPTGGLDFDDDSGPSRAERIMLLPYGDPADGRPHINPASQYGDSSPVIKWGTASNIGIVGIEIYPTYRDPDHADWAGWDASLVTKGIGTYTATADSEGVLIEDCAIKFCDGAINFQTDNGYGFSDYIVRRTVMQNCHENTGNNQGLFIASSSATVTPDLEILVEDCTFYHNGWYNKATPYTGTANSGSTTTCVVSPSPGWTTDQWKTGPITNSTDATSGTITGNTADTLSFSAGDGMDFTGGGDSFTIGGSASGNALSQATLFNHNLYLGGVNNSIFRNNHFLDSSSIAFKITSAPKTGQRAHPVHDIRVYDNLLIYNEIGLHDFGNSGNNSTRFQDVVVVDNVHVEGGATKPTNRDIGWMYGMQDWNRGLMGNNIGKDTGQTSPVVKNIHGLRISGINTNSQIVKNKFVNLGVASGSNGAGHGCLHMENSDLSENGQSPLTLSGVLCYQNDFQQIDVDGLTVADWQTSQTSGITMSGNRYYAPKGDTQAVAINSTLDSFADFITETGETGYTNAEVSYITKGCSIAGYQTVRGGTATTAAFITECLGQRKGDWDATLEPKEVNAYFQEALGE